jgi:PAS domain S-box-containing protein
LWQDHDTRLAATPADARALQARLDLILDSITEAVVAVTAEGKVVCFNRAAERLWSRSASEVLGQHVGMLIAGGWTDKHERAQQRAIAGETAPRTMEFVCAKPDGVPFIVEGLRTRMELDGEVVLAGFWRDITERTAGATALIEAKEIAEAANRAKSEFLAAMSHEIRTPLNGVLGMAAALETTPLTDLQKRMIGVINESGQTLMTLLSDILDLSKIEAGRMEFENEPFDLAGSVEGVASLFAETAKAKGLKFQVSLDDGARATFRGDSTRIRQVLQNLISNAVKFTKSGAVVVRVAGTDADQGRRDLLVEVIDTGVGISEEGRARLFSKFMQADSSTSRHFGGTGLGLAICRELVTAMGGEIAVDSEEGKGSRFWFRLPLELAEGVPAAATEAPVEEADAERPLRILAAEDNATNQFVLKAILGQKGLEAEFVENGRLALEAVQTGDFDVILMDLHMPEMDGLSATQAIRALGGPKSTIPIIAVTAEAMPEQVRKCLAAGMDAHVSKPIRPDVLYGVIEEVLTRAHGVRAA